MATTPATDAARADAALALARVLDGATLARVIEAVELHAGTLSRLDQRSGDGTLGEDARSLASAARFFRDVNIARPMIRLAR